MYPVQISWSIKINLFDRRLDHVQIADAPLLGK